MVVISRCETSTDRFRRRPRSDRYFRAANEPYGDEDESDCRHHDRYGAMVQNAEQQIAEPDADHERRQQQQKVRLRPCRRLPVAQREQVHRDEQWREKAAGRHRIHHDRQQRDADDGEPSAECALHEADQEYAGKGDEDRGGRQLHAAAFTVARSRPPVTSSRTP